MIISDDIASSFGVLRLPAQISYGSGSLGSLPAVVRRLGTRVFICCDPFLEEVPLFAAAVRQLTELGVTCRIWTKIIPELPVDSVEQAAEGAREFGPDAIIGFGGGSSMDLAKVTALLLDHGGPLGRYYGENAVPGPVLPVVAVPTTAGTGSEVTPVAVVSDPDRELKVGISSPELIPRHAIVDPRLALGTPPTVTAHAGIDAFVHAVEAFTAADRSPAWARTEPVFVGRNLLSSLLAERAAGLIAEYLPLAVQKPNDLAAREAMAYGSLLAGMAFGSAGTHLSHAIQYPVGALTKTPHGLGTGLLLPYVLRACLPELQDDLRRLGRALGVDAADPAEAADQVITRIAQLNATIGLPPTLAAVGITEDQLPRIVELAGTITRLVHNAVVEPTPNRIDRIVRSAWSGS